MTSDMTEVALGHPAVLGKLRGPEWTGKLAAMASDTKIAVYENYAVVFIAKNRAGGTSHGARRISTMLTGERKVAYAGGRVLPFFMPGHMAKGHDLICSQVVLILTGNRTCHTARTAGNVKGESILGHDLPSSFRGLLDFTKE
jgi:hypothetical protein